MAYYDEDGPDTDWGDEPDWDGEPIEFADPGGNSALRAGHRIFPCPTCEAPNRLTQKDVNLGYQCDSCADRAERGWDY